MRSDVIVIAGIGSQNPAQMPLAPDDDMIHTLAPDWSDQPFGKTVLPRRCWCDGFIAYAHSANSARGNVTIDAILIPDEVAWCLIPGKRLGQLACNPFSRRICCNVDPDELPPIQPDDDENVEQVEANGRDNEQIHGSNVWCVVTQKNALPDLAVPVAWPCIWLPSTVRPQSRA